MRLLQPGGNWFYINSAATTQCVTGECVLRGVTVNGGTLSGTITIYDDTASTASNIVAIIGATQILGSGGYPFMIQMNRGCRIVTSAAVNITVSVDQ